LLPKLPTRWQWLATGVQFPAFPGVSNCLCGSRILVQEGIYEKFKIEFVKKVKALKVGDPLDPAVNLGAVVSKSHMEKIKEHIQIAKDEGGNVLCGGKQVVLNGDNRNGWFLEPTVIEGLDNTCRTNQEEIFGPVVTLQSFKDEEEALELANGTSYGLSATLWTSDLKRAHRMGHNIHAGIVWINCWLVRDLRTPFGGTKNSGVGREGGFEALRFFTEPKNICISLK
jgi:aminomuconate-semialdehyde/2-hydroxymuconate-6-semialdehyde dehydrogenase